MASEDDRGRRCDGGELRSVGVTRPVSAEHAEALAAVVALRPDATVRRVDWRAREDARPVTAVRPVPVEITTDSAADGGIYRHAATLVRVRTDLVADGQAWAADSVGSEHG